MILIVTSNAALRNGLSAYLKERDYAACFPDHRQDTVGLVDQHHPQVMVLDLYISQPNGLAFLQTLRTHGYAGKVLALSGVSNRNLISNIQKMGVDQVINYSSNTPSSLVYDQIESMIRGIFRMDIAKRAYEIYAKRGGQHGRDLEDWFTAEQEIIQTLRGLVSP